LCEQRWYEKKWREMFWRGSIVRGRQVNMHSVVDKMERTMERHTPVWPELTHITPLKLGKNDLALIERAFISSMIAAALHCHSTTP
jgi:hypothetical protein